MKNNCIYSFSASNNYGKSIVIASLKFCFIFITFMATVKKCAKCSRKYSTCPLAAIYKEDVIILMVGPLFSQRA